VPELGGPGQEQDRQRSLGDATHGVRGEHDELARETIRPDAADEHETDEREDVRREDDPEVGCRARQLEDGEGERDGNERVAEDRGRLPEEEEAEAPLGERPESPGPLHASEPTCAGSASALGA